MEDLRNRLAKSVTCGWRTTTCPRCGSNKAFENEHGLLCLGCERTMTRYEIKVFKAIFGAEE